MAAKKTTKKKYTAEMLISGRKFTGKGADIRSAIADIKSPGAVKVKSVLIVSNGKDSQERILPPFMINRLFNASGTTRDIALSQLSERFGV